MRQVTRKGLITVAAAGGMLATFTGGTALADSAVQRAAGSGPGVLSGNNVEAPVNAPVNVCGNTVSVVGELNEASGTRCSAGGSQRVSGRAGDAPGGIASGNNVEAPVYAPVNVCGNSVNVAGVGNSASADCDGGSEAAPPEEESPEEPGPENPGPENPGPENPGPENPGPENPTPDGPDDGASTPPNDTPTSDVRTRSEPVNGELAHTGAGDMIGIGAPLSAGLLIGGFVLYRRASRLARR